MPRNDLKTYPTKVGYRKHAGYVAWLLHRITGVIIVIYFLAHMLGSAGVCSFLADLKNIAAVKGVMIVALAFHALNGLRIILMEFGSAAERESNKSYFIAVIVLTIILSAAGIYYLNF